ncbi:hypothetical protein CGMCC3_g16419 [Colletotrichum fructicola]|nr:uncharacterized protein CGMCC3_g16419 [Colletotrichum fructicola]KAE9567472.1 hypothetical protein CGMCC3_g16419 [Colletotrichum fructicola]
MEGESLTSLFKILKTDFMFNCLVISVGSQSNTARKAGGNIAPQLEGIRLCEKNGEDAGTYELQRLEHFCENLAQAWVVSGRHRRCPHGVWRASASRLGPGVKHPPGRLGDHSQYY